MDLMWWYLEEGKRYKCELGMRKLEWGVGKGGLRNGECGMRNGEVGVRKSECGIVWERLLAAKCTIYLLAICNEGELFACAF